MDKVGGQICTLKVAPLASLEERILGPPLSGHQIFKLLDVCGRGLFQLVVIRLVTNPNYWMYGHGLLTKTLTEQFLWIQTNKKKSAMKIN